LFNNGTSLNVDVYVGLLYALTDRWVFSAALPYVFGRYTDPAPPPPFIPFLPVDACRCWHSGVQDYDFTARFNVVNGPFALTPSISVGVPSHDYPYGGESVVGRSLRELRIAVDAGHRLDAISPRLSVDGRYAYAFVEQVLDIPNNRSNASVTGSYLVRPRLSVRGEVLWQRTHGGLRVGSPPPSDFLWQRTHGGLRTGSPPPSDFPPPGEVNTPERLTQHDRLLRDNSMHLTGGVSYQLSRFDVFASYRAFISGTDTHAGRAVTTGVSWPFEFSR
jgi:hypothetical protein